MENEEKKRGVGDKFRFVSSPAAGPSSVAVSVNLVGMRSVKGRKRKHAEELHSAGQKAK